MKFPEALTHFPPGTPVWQSNNNGAFYAYDVHGDDNKATQYSWDANGDPIIYGNGGSGTILWNDVADFLAKPDSGYTKVANPNDNEILTILPATLDLRRSNPPQDRRHQGGG